MAEIKTLALPIKPPGFDRFVSNAMDVMGAKKREEVEKNVEVILAQTLQLANVVPAEITEFMKEETDVHDVVRFSGVTGTGDKVTLQYDARNHVMFSSVRVKRFGGSQSARKIKKLTVMVTQGGRQPDLLQSFSVEIQNEKPTEANEVLVYQLGETVTVQSMRNHFAVQLPKNQRWFTSQCKGNTFESTLNELLGELRSPEGDPKYNPDTF